jgi:nicotinamidase-related amidase
MPVMNFIESKGHILELAERLDPSRTALLVVDVQNDFCHPDGVFGRIGHDTSMMPKMVAKLQDLVDAARRNKILIIWIRATYDEVFTSAALAESFNRRHFVQSQCLEGSWGAEWFGGLCPAESAGEVVLTKHRFSPFWDTPIDLYLRSNGIRSVAVTGVVTSGCVESTVRDAFFNDYYVTVPSDCVAEASKERHSASLAKIEQAFGLVLSGAQIAELWDRSQTPEISWSFERKEASALLDLSHKLEPNHTALILVDLQRDFCHADGTMGRRGENLMEIQAAVTAAQHILEVARATGVLIVHLRAQYGTTDASDTRIAAELQADSSDCCVPGTWGAEFMTEVTPRSNEPVVVKHRFSGFVDTELEKLLRTNRISSLVVVGVATQCCVECTVRDGALRDYYVVVPRDAVAARGRMRHLHNASLETMGLYFADIRNAAEVCSVWMDARRLVA